MKKLFRRIKKKLVHYSTILTMDNAIYLLLEGATETLKSPGLRTVQVELNIKAKQYQSSIDLITQSGFRLIRETPHGGDGSWRDHLFVRA